MAATAGIRDRIDVADLEQIDPNGYGFLDHFDILLDPQPNSRFLETCRALWMGVPVMAIAGAGYLGRQASAALSAAGRPDWVFHSNQARAAAIADLVADLDYLADLRATLRGEVSASALSMWPASRERSNKPIAICSTVAVCSAPTFRGPEISAQRSSLGSTVSTCPAMQLPTSARRIDSRRSIPA